MLFEHVHAVRAYIAGLQAGATVCFDSAENLEDVCLLHIVPAYQLKHLFRKLLAPLAP